jgi:hypothetical protein
MMAYALAGGVASAAGANLEKLRTEAKDAKEMRMASFNRESAQLLQTDQQDFMNKENVRKEGIQVGQFDATSEQSKNQFEVTSGLQRDTLNATVEGNRENRQMQRDLQTQQLQMQEDLTVLKESGADARQIKALEGQIDAIKVQTEGSIEAYSAKIQQEHEVANKSFSEFKKTAKWDSLPESMKALTELQFSVSGTADISKFLGTMSSSSSSSLVGPDGKFHSPSASHFEKAMETLSEDESFDEQTPAARLTMAAKVATQIANGIPISYSGKAVRPDDYSQIARELSNGDREFGELRVLNKESIDGIMIEYEKIHPSAELSAATSSPARTAMPAGGVLSNVASKQELTPGRQGIGMLRNAFSGTDDEGVSDLQRKAAMEFK